MTRPSSFISDKEQLRTIDLAYLIKLVRQHGRKVPGRGSADSGVDLSHFAEVLREEELARIARGMSSRRILLWQHIPGYGWAHVLHHVFFYVPEEPPQEKRSLALRWEYLEGYGWGDSLYYLPEEPKAED